MMFVRVALVGSDKSNFFSALKAGGYHRHSGFTVVHTGPETWHLQLHGRVKGLPSSLHPQVWQTLALSTFVLDLAAGRS